MLKKISLLLSVLFLLSACGGGGDTTTSTTVTNTVPSDSSVRMGGKLPKLIELSESISPEILNIPEEASIKWVVDGIIKGNIQNYKFDAIGNHTISAEIISKQGKLLNLLKQNILVSKNKKITTLTATSEGSTFYREDAENDDLSGFEIVFPEEAVPSDKEIALEMATLDGLGSFAVSLKPHGLTFEKPVKVTIPYDKSLGDSDIEITRFSKNGEKIFLPILSIDKDNHLVTFLTDHFSTYTAFSKVLGFTVNDELDNVKSRLSNWNGTDDELIKILDFAPNGSTTIFDYYLFDKENRAIVEAVGKKDAYSEYKKLYPEFGLSPVWESVSKGLGAVSAIQGMDKTLGSVVATTVSLVTGVNIPSAPQDVGSKLEWANSIISYGTDALAKYDPVNEGEKILKLAADLYWNDQLDRYISARGRTNPSCDVNLELSPSCQFEAVNYDTYYGFYPSATAAFLPGATEVQKMTPMMKKNFWRDAESFYQRYILGKSNTSTQLNNMVLAVKDHFQALEDKNNPTVTGMSVDPIGKYARHDLYKGIPKNINVLFDTKGFSSNASHVTLSRFDGSNFVDRLTANDCGVNNPCVFSVKSDVLGSDLQYRVNALFDNPKVGWFKEDFSVSVIEQYQVKNVVVKKVTSLPRDRDGYEQYDLLIEPSFVDSSGQPVSISPRCSYSIGGYSRICDESNLRLTKRLINDIAEAGDKMEVTFTEFSFAYDFKNGNDGKITVSFDLDDAAQMIKNGEPPVSTAAASIKITKVNGIANYSNNLDLNAGDRVEFELSGVSSIIRADFDGNGRYSSNLSSPELQEVVSNSNYIQTFNVEGTFVPKIKYKNSSNVEQFVELDGSIHVIKGSNLIPDSVQWKTEATYSFGSNSVELLVSSNKDISSVRWTQIKGTKVTLTPSLISRSPKFDIPVSNGENEKITFRANIKNFEGKRTFRFVSFNLQLLGEPESSLPNIDFNPVARITHGDLSYVRVSDSIVLDGRTSSDNEGSIQSYQWFDGAQEVGSNSTVTLSSLTQGRHFIKLIVEDGAGQTDERYVSFTVQDSGVTELDFIPVARITHGDLTQLVEGDSVTLKGDSSTDREGAIQSYQWFDGTQVIGSKSTITLSNLTKGRHFIKLVVEDSAGQTTKADVVLNVHEQATLDFVPVAVITHGDLTQLVEGDSVMLSGETSSDREGPIQSYQWFDGTQVIGSKSTITLSNLTKGRHFIKLVVEDSAGQTTKADVILNVSKNVSTSLVWTPEMSNNKTYYLSGACNGEPSIEKVTLHSNGTGNYSPVTDPQGGSGSFNHRIGSNGYLYTENTSENREEYHIVREVTSKYILIEDEPRGTSGNVEMTRMYFILSEATTYANSSGAIERCNGDSTNPDVNNSDLANNTIEITSQNGSTTVYTEIITKKIDVYSGKRVVYVKARKSNNILEIGYCINNNSNQVCNGGDWISIIRNTSNGEVINGGTSYETSGGGPRSVNGLFYGGQFSGRFKISNMSVINH